MSTSALVAALSGEPAPKPVAAGRRRWYRMHDHDADLKGKGAVEIAGRAEATRWNAQGWGIFWTVNEFDGPRRIDHLTRIAAWAVDIDTGDKEAQQAKLLASPLVPSLVVETRRGFQAYWGAKDGCVESWNSLVLDRLVPHYGADRNARDIARILRVPGFLHQKDPSDPFVIRTVWRHAVTYTALQVAERYPDRGAGDRTAQAQAQCAATKREIRFKDSDGFWDRVYNLDCAAALERLSGHWAVKGERFTFKRNRSGTQNIWADGKSTSCWIDKNGRIGSADKGGPTIYQWLAWYGNTPRESVDVIKRVFPEVERG